MLNVVSWNCNQNFKTKFQLLRKNLDIYVIQESEKLDSDFFTGYSSHWTGKSNNKGLAVLTKNDSKLAEIYDDSKFKYVLPVEIGSLRLLAVWLFNHRIKDGEPYESGYFIDAFKYYKEWLIEGKETLVIGDFNNSIIWDKENKKNNWCEIVALLREIGLESAYHSVSGEPFGVETKNTYFMHKDSQKKYHIDYVFKKRNILSKIDLEEFKSFSEYSDHVPIYAYLEI